MTPGDLLDPFDSLDLAAVLILTVAWFFLGFRIERTTSATPSVTVLMGAYRREWMRQFVTRTPRIYDASVLGNLRQSTSWMASTTMIALGGLFALIGNTDPLISVAEDLALTARNARTVEIKLLLTGLFLAHAFLKFLWSNRLFGYSAVIMSAVPNDPGDPLALPRAMQAAEVGIRAAVNFNRGLRATYFALASLSWLLGSWALLAATVAVVWLVWSREFASHSRAILLDPPPPARNRD
ncbi:MAG: DUF599 domain-containing protein [Pararhodobacter sp.]